MINWNILLLTIKTESFANKFGFITPTGNRKGGKDR